MADYRGSTEDNNIIVDHTKTLPVASEGNASAIFFTQQSQVTQEVATEIGKTYVLAFDAAPVYANASGFVNVDGEQRLKFHEDLQADSRHPDYHRHVVEFTATKATTKIGFSGVRISLDNTQLVEGNKPEYGRIFGHVDAPVTASVIVYDNDHDLLLKRDIDGTLTPLHLGKPAPVDPTAIDWDSIGGGSAIDIAQRHVKHDPGQRVVAASNSPNGIIATTEEGLQWLVNNNGESALVGVNANWLQPRDNWYDDLVNRLKHETDARGGVLDALTGSNALHAVRIHGLTISDIGRGHHKQTRESLNDTFGYDILGQLQNVTFEHAGAVGYGVFPPAVSPAAPAKPVTDDNADRLHDNKNFQPISAFWDADKTTLVIANTPTVGDKLALLRVDDSKQKAWLYDPTTQAVYEQQLVDKDRVLASFDAYSITSNSHREDQTHYIPRARQVLPDNPIQDLQFSSDGLLAVTDTGLIVALDDRGETVMGVTSTWTAVNGVDLPDNLAINPYVAVHDGLNERSHISAFTFADDPTVQFSTAGITGDGQVRVLGLDDDTRQAYLTKPAADGHDVVYQVGVDGTTTKFGDFEIALRADDNQKTALLLKAQDGDTEVTVPSIDGVDRLVLSGGVGQDTFTINSAALRHYRHIAIDSIFSNTQTAPDVINIEGILDATDTVASVHGDDVLLVNTLTGHSLEFTHVIDAQNASLVDNITIRSLGLPPLSLSEVFSHEQLTQALAAGDTVNNDSQTTDETTTAVSPVAVRLDSVYLRKLSSQLALNHQQGASAADTDIDTDAADAAHTATAPPKTPPPAAENDTATDEGAVHRLVQAMSGFDSSSGDASLDGNGLADDDARNTLLSNPNRDG